MLKFSHRYTTLANAIPLTAMAVALLLGTLLLGGLYWQLSRLAENQQSLLGNTLAGLLAEAVQQPLLSNDRISLQVALDRVLSDSPLVIRASALNLNNRLIAQAQRPTSSTIESYTQPVTMENAIAGYIRVELATDAVKAPYLTPFWFATILWLLFSLAALTGLQQRTKLLSQRLLQLGKALPAAPDEPTELNELELLEKRIAPLLTPGSSAHQGVAEDEQSCTLAILCHNLSRVRAQLTHENTHNLLQKLDLAIASACRLYEGERLPGNGNCTFIRFSSATSQASDYPLHALCCAKALLDICRAWTEEQGIPLEISASLNRHNVPAGETDWLKDMHLSEHLQQATLTAEFAAPWQIVMDAATSSHPAISECAGTEALPAADNIHQFSTLSEPQQVLLGRQVQYLHSQLQFQ